MITTEQKVQVAKDRVIDEFSSLITNSLIVDCYKNLTHADKQAVRELGRLLSLPDNSEETLMALDSYINDEEELFFQE